MDQHYYYHLNLRNMTGRVVKFRLLDVLELEKVNENAAREAGPDADMQKLRNVQLKHSAAAFIVAVSEPGQKPAMKAASTGEVGIDGGVPDLEGLKEAKWTPITDAATLMRDWGRVFNAKETAAIYAVFRDWHEISGLEIDMILGKSLPVPSGA